MWGMLEHAEVRETGGGVVGGDQDGGSLVFVPCGDGLMQQGQPAAAVGQQPAGTEGLPLFALSGRGAAPLLSDMPQLDAALLPPLPDLPMAAGGAGGGGTGQPAESSFAATAGGAVDKQAIAREKNRLAQQRFREKERQKLAEAEAAAAAVRRQLSQLRLENERLQMEHALLQKLLVVRDAILSVVVQLDGQAAQPGPQPGLPLQQPAAMQQSGGTLGAAAAGPSVTALLQDPAAVQAASQQLAAALGELPSLEQMELMVAELGGDNGAVTDAGGSSGGASSGAGSSSATGSQATDGRPAGTAAALIPPAGVMVGAAAASGVVVERTRLQEVAPLPCPEARKEVEGIDHVESMLEYWQQWRLQLRELFQEAQAANFSDPELQNALLEQTREFVSVFWAACHDRPQLFNRFLTRCLPPPGVDASAEWKRVAQESLPHLSDSEVAMFRRAMQQYTKRVAIAAVGVRPWVQRLQAVVAAQHSGADSLSHMAGQHAQVREVVSRVQHACTEQYLAYMGFIAMLSAHTSITLRALWHTSSDTYAPDHPAIVNEILHLHQQRQRQQLADPQPGGAVLQAQLAAPEPTDGTAT